MEPGPRNTGSSDMEPSQKYLGEITTKDCVVFDEICKIELTSVDEIMGKLYMESGCQLRILRSSRSNEGPSIHRQIHGFIPRWEVPKIVKSTVYISKHYGFVTDYFAEILHELKKKTEFYYHVSDKV